MRPVLRQTPGGRPHPIQLLPDSPTPTRVSGEVTHFLAYIIPNHKQGPCIQPAAGNQAVQGVTRRAVGVAPAADDGHISGAAPARPRGASQRQPRDHGEVAPACPQFETGAALVDAVTTCSRPAAAVASALPCQSGDYKRLFHRCFHAAAKVAPAVAACD